MADILQGDYRISLSQDSIFVQHISYSQILTIEKFSSQVYESEPEILNKVAIYGSLKPHAILGMIKIGVTDFLVYVKTAQIVGTLEESEIYKIKEADMIPVTDEITANNLPSEVKSFVCGIKNFLALGFFYSFHYDLTNTKQRQSKRESNSLFDSADRKYFWNYNLYKKFTNEKKSVSKVWMVVCIFGYVGVLMQAVVGNRLNLCLISRRSVHHAGTRYNTRGIDDEGHVANYVETEQIVRCAKHIMSFVQLRGSAPIFFRQTGVTAQTQVTRIPGMTSASFLRHMEDIQKELQMVFIVNLMNTTKPNEQIITQNLENQIRMNSLKSCRYFFFDFQNECKYDNYDKLDIFVNNIENVLNIFKFYCEDVNSAEIHKEQCGVVRTNCLDCLDRTNVIQTRIAWKILEIQLKFLNIDTTNIFEPSFINPQTKPHPLMDIFKDIWADNGDFISIQYAGTASTITSVTKNGKHGFLGMFQHGLVSLTRFYQGSFEDSFKQKCFELFLQKTHLDNLCKLIYFNSDSDPILEEELKNYEEKYTRQEELSVYIGSWNVAGKEPRDGQMFFEWLFPMKDSKVPDIYIIGLQEIVDLNAKNIVLSSNSSKVESWRSLISAHLSKIDNYCIIMTLDLVGIFFIVFVKESIKENVTNIETQSIRTGLLGTMGNKGSCLIRFNYLDTSFAVACGHFSAGERNISARIGEVNDVLNKSFQFKGMKYRDHDVNFLFGDLNFRIDLDIQTCKQMISSGSLGALSAHDQLNKAKSVTTSLIGLEEGPLSFNPTYKYCKGTSEYDMKKKRTPSWCDRVLFKKSSQVQLLDYNSVDYTISDHKPIYALFKVNTTKLDLKLRQQIIDELKEKLNLTGNMISTSEDFDNDLSSHINDDFFNSSKFNSSINSQLSSAMGKLPEGEPQLDLPGKDRPKSTNNLSNMMMILDNLYGEKDTAKGKKGGFVNNILTYFKK